MPNSDRRFKTVSVAAAVLASAALLSTACGGGSGGPQQGTPEWYMQAATDNYALKDFAKTLEQLEEAMKAEGDIGQRAMLWRATVLAGLARGYDTLADACVDGIEANEARTDEFQNLINGYRRSTRQNAFDFYEVVGAIQEVIEAGEAVALDFPLPPGNDSVSPLLESLKMGNSVGTQLPAMETQTLIRGIFSVLSDFTGGDDFAKLTAASASEAGLQAASDAMAFGVARILLDVSMMFDREGVNEPRPRGTLLDSAEKWGEPHYEREEIKDSVEDFKFDVENERRDMAGKRRIKKDD